MPSCAVPKIIQTGDLLVHLDTKTVEVNGQSVYLTGSPPPEIQTSVGICGDLIVTMGGSGQF
jgi:hypothetical protein